MTGWPLESFCHRCCAKATAGCVDHPTQLVHLLDVRGMWREHNERIASYKQVEARMLGEAA